jgi:hypothetical protein
MHESNSSATSLIILLILFNCHAVPSSHTAFVVGLTTALGMLEGTQSNLFALALVLSLVVAYDATGVRLHAGRHASVLNILIAGEPRLPLVPLVANNGCCCSAHEAMQLCNFSACSCACMCALMAKVCCTAVQSWVLPHRQQAWSGTHVS